MELITQKLILNKKDLYSGKGICNSIKENMDQKTNLPVDNVICSILYRMISEKERGDTYGAN